MKNTGERQSVFKKGKGRAFLKFLIGELLLIGIACFVYLFILQGDVSVLLPKSVQNTEAPAGNAEGTHLSDDDAADLPTAEPTKAPTEAPTEAPTPEPTEAPTPAPTATPVPFEQLSLPLGDAAPEVPVMPDEKLKLGMSELYSFSEAGQRVVVVSGYAYIEGLDAANSDIYLLVSNAANADPIALYPAISAPEMENLSFEESSDLTDTERGSGGFGSTGR